MAINWDLIIPKPKNKSKDEDDPLARPSITMIVGGTGSGKSTVLANLLMALQDKHEFDSGLFITSNNRDPILDTVEMPISTSPKALDEYITSLQQAREGTNHILVLDDIQGSDDFRVMRGQSRFTNFLLSHRHYGEDRKKPGKNGTWIILTAQTLKNSYSPVIRAQVKNWILYPPRVNNHLKDYLEMVKDPPAMKRAMGYIALQGPHEFLYLNKNDPLKDRYFQGFKNELVDLY